MSRFQRKPLVDRRSGRDRRQVDRPPPAGRERRLGMEPRKPEVVELDMTHAEWVALSSSLSIKETPGRPKFP